MGQMKLFDYLNYAQTSDLSLIDLLEIELFDV